MAKRLPKKDAVIIGFGWTGSIMANELTDAGLEVMAIERGPWRDAPTDFPPSYMQDELRYRIGHELFLRPDQLTFSFRNKIDQTACRSEAGARSCRRTASVVAAFTGMPKCGDFCPPTSC
jgi:gluconate 2-dehydrogenase alpha chain